MEYERFTVPVRGGDLTVGSFGPKTGPVILALHGITASHRSFVALAKALPEYRIIAPDLRGRGRSAGLPGPWRLETHVVDAVAVLDACGVDRALIVGHSMGALVSIVLATTHPERTKDLLLIDGGLPLALPPGLDEAAAIAAQLGPSVARLSMTFTRDSYAEFWRNHPAFTKLAAGDSADIQGYADYDLVMDASGVGRSAASSAAVTADSSDLFGPPHLLDGLAKLPKTTLMVAPHWLTEGSAPLLGGALLDSWRPQLPSLEVVEVPDTNHFTILMSDAGASVVASTIRSL